jgi:hypothetical protein
VSGLTLCQDLVTDSPELALEVAEEIVYRFRERGRGVIGGGFVVHLLCLEIGPGRLRWLCLRSEGVGSLEECSVRHGWSLMTKSGWGGERERGQSLRTEDVYVQRVDMRAACLQMLRSLTLSRADMFDDAFNPVNKRVVRAGRQP